MLLAVFETDEQISPLKHGGKTRFMLQMAHRRIHTHTVLKLLPSLLPEFNVLLTGCWHTGRLSADSLGNNRKSFY